MDEPQVELLTTAHIRDLLERTGARPTKKLGQNFVTDPGTVRRIVRTAGVNPGDVVVEVGPGLGSLTLGLLEVGAKVIAVEIDPVLAERLPETVATQAPGLVENLRVLTADAMTVREMDIEGEPPTRLVANLPYNVAVPVLLTMLERFPSLAEILVMVQAEVADRIAAPPGARPMESPRPRPPGTPKLPVPEPSAGVCFGQPPMWTQRWCGWFDVIHPPWVPAARPRLP